MPKFQKGQSGNPDGRPPGLGKVAKLRAALEADLPDILNTLITAARQGDTAAAKLILDRVLPPLRPIDAPLMLGELPDGLGEKAQAIVALAASGGLPPNQASELIAAIANVARVEELSELRGRIVGLEAALRVSR